MADLDKLKIELDSDPLNRGYATMTAAEGMASLTSADRPVVVHQVITPQLLAALFGTATAAAMLDAMEAAAESDSQLKWMLRIMYESRGGLRTDTPGVMDKLAALAAVGTVITEPQLAIFNAAMQKSVDRLTELDIGPIHMGDLLAAAE